MGEILDGDVEGQQEILDGAFQKGITVITGLTGTAWRIVYIDSAGEVQELALGADNTVLKSIGASGVPEFAAVALSEATGSITDIGAGNWKVLHSNSSGVITELTLGADNTVLKSTGATGAPEFAKVAASELTGTNWRILYVNDSGVVTELAFGTDGQVLTSTGVSTAPAFEDAAGGAGWNDPSTKTDDHTILTSEFSTTFRMNAATEKTFTLPSVGADEDGEQVRLVKQGAGRVNITASDSDTIDSSSTAAGTMYNEQAGETYASVTLEYVHGITKWIVTSARGTWSLT